LQATGIRYAARTKCPELVQRYCDGETLDELQHQSLREIAALWREQLTNISRFRGILGHLNFKLSLQT